MKFAAVYYFFMMITTLSYSFRFSRKFSGTAGRSVALMATTSEKGKKESKVILFIIDDKLII
jgi:hypothetical protein